MGEPAFCYLTTTGRRTGRPHTIEIWFARDGGSAYLLAGGRERADWVQNLMAQPDLRLRVEGEEWPARARVLEDGSEEDARARRLVLAKYQAPGEHGLDHWGRTALVVAIDVPAWR